MVRGWDLRLGQDRRRLGLESWLERDAKAWHESHRISQEDLLEPLQRPAAQIQAIRTPQLAREVDVEGIGCDRCRVVVEQCRVVEQAIEGPGLLSRQPHPRLIKGADETSNPLREHAQSGL